MIGFLFGLYVAWSFYHNRGGWIIANRPEGGEDSPAAQKFALWCFLLSPLTAPFMAILFYFAKITDKQS